MRELDMLPTLKKSSTKREPYVARSSTWIRAPQSGIFRSIKSLGEKVEKDELLGLVSDPFGEDEESVRALHSGIIIGRTNIPLVNEGEALFHIARFENSANVLEKVEEFQNEMNPATDKTTSNEPPIV